MFIQVLFKGEKLILADMSMSVPNRANIVMEEYFSKLE